MAEEEADTALALAEPQHLAALAVEVVRTV